MHTIRINGNKVFRPNGFTLEREDLYASEITTLSGNTIADLIGWKYSDMTLNWDMLPEQQLKTILDMSGECELIFEDADGVTVRERIMRTSAVTTASRFVNENGNALWRNVSCSIKFLNAHK